MGNNRKMEYQKLYCKIFDMSRNVVELDEAIELLDNLYKNKSRPKDKTENK